MEITIDTKPPPGPTLRELIAGLEPGQSLCSPSHSTRVARVTASRVKGSHPDRDFRVKYEAGEGVRVWRLA